MRSRQIEPKLFDFLQDVGQLIEKTINESKDEKAKLMILEIRDKLTVFCKNFFIQFFYGGYGYVIDGINATTMNKIKAFFSYRLDVPPKMIKLLSKYVDINIDIMGDPYTEKTRTSKELYCYFLPDLFVAFKEEVNEVIDNFAQVAQKMDETLGKIEDICKRLD
jgi:hypothetical protein